VAFGLVICTECTSDVWVGGAAKAVVWLAAECWIDNCCNYFVNCSTGLVCAEPMIPTLVCAEPILLLGNNTLRTNKLGLNLYADHDLK
jgi:hypothetical protein